MVNPLFPFLVRGTIFDLDNAARSDANVLITNVTTGETLPVTTSDSAGKYLIDIANLPSGYSEGNSIKVTASYPTQGEKSETFTISLPAGGVIQNITLALIDDKPFDAGSSYQLVKAVASSVDGKAYTSTYLLPIAVKSLIPGVGTTNLGKAEDAVHSSGDVGVMALGVRKDNPVVLAADGDYTPLQTSDQGGLWTENVPNEVDAGNSTTSTLTDSEVFTGTGVDILHYDIVTVTLDASHDSATDGMTFQFSIDDTNWDDVYTFTYTAADGARRFQFPVTAKFFRIVYTNGGTGQSHFRVQTILHHNNSLTTIHRLVDDVSNDRSAQIMKSAIIAQRGGGGPGAGDFIPVQATTAGNLKFSLEEIDSGAFASTLLTASKTTSSDSAVAIASTATTRKVNVRADTANTTTVLVGNSSTQVYPLFPGEAIDIDINDISNIFIKRSGGANVTINYLAW